MDIDIFSDLKIRKLIKYQGGKAISIYALLLCNIYKNGYYMEWDDELPFICSELTGFDEAYVSEVLKTCLSLGLFSKELFETERVLTSRGIQERYSRICVQCRRICDISNYNLLSEKAASPRRKMPEQRNEDAGRKDVPPRSEPYSLTLDQEIEKLKNDEAWLCGLRAVHRTDAQSLRGRLEAFRAQCVADGKEKGHQSIQDAKQHFNSWLRIVNKTKAKDDKDRSKGRNQRGGDVLSPDGPKTYGDTF